MSALYIHIPFCKQACHYCNFHFSTSLKYKGRMLEAIGKELVLQKDYLQGAELQSVYFGGGTPSLLSASEIMQLWSIIETHYNLGPNMEVTLEANPDDMKLDKLRSYKLHTPINRLSIGLQSFLPDELSYMNRAHSAEEAENCLANALAVGFEQLSVDLIYGGPFLSNEDWRKAIRKLFAFQVPHLSAYALTLEPNTPLEHLVRRNKLPALDEERAAQHFEILLEECILHDYEQYEISNFCRNQQYAKHNSSYWKGRPYLGIGPSAHSFNGHSRQWNVANNMKYINALEDNQLLFEIEELSPTEQFNELLMTRLRTKWGLSLQEVEKRWGNNCKQQLLRQIQPFIQDHLAHIQTNYIYLTDAGKLLSDHILAELFLEDIPA
ncbi:radical SAM family heme chaperone HemW [Saprospira sp. CCB-QB6]|uniref:radical SAM family heme chaperone HemW n=1 Tax=Saprospira sp. CCB-QB6 TaxID=3023936 RepID=UPI002349E499|nr:radical SAM family heme chaperone HemW [Saprospira sp. CCB-QB6]WCL82188.1 radical SAM family heme chaperone HemW [Saprospira sp. CCB-QB6]